MVILLCQTPRRGVVAIVDYAPPPSLPKRVKNYCDDKEPEDHRYCSTDDDSPSTTTGIMTATPTNGQSCFPFAVNCRFDKTFFGVPKKCGYCLKMVYGTGFACQNCRFRCHKRCVMLTYNTQPYLRQKVCSLSRLPTGDDNVVKELITKCEINCNNYDEDDVFRERKSSVPERYNIYNYPSSPPLSVASGSSNAYSSLETINEQPQLSTSRSDSTPGMVQRFLNFLPWNKEQQPPQPQVQKQMQCETSASDSSRKSSSSVFHPPQLKTCASEPATTSLRPLDLSFPGSGHASSSCSPQVRTPVDEFNSIILEELFNQQKTQHQQLQRKLKWVNHIVGDRGAYSQDCVTVESRRSKEEHKHQRGASYGQNQQSSSMRSSQKDKLVASWPLSGLHMNLEDSSSQHAEHCEDETCCTAEEEEWRKRDSRVSELGEWTIPYSDLDFGECVLETRTMKIHKGRWHGDVMIHTYNLGENNHLISGFLDDVRTFTKIRHENVALFMGASIEVPLLAVVTSVRKGDSLYESIYLKQKRLPLPTKVAVARQIAQGMGYLHAKGIVLKSLTSKSIYLECKVKISMVDSGAPLKQHERFEKGCVRRGHLTYWSPELIKTLRVEPPTLVVDLTKATKESDVYAFGTVMYEMFAGDFPFAQESSEAVIWQIGNGIKQRLNELGCSTSLKSLIDVCWSFDAALRPTFLSIFKELQHTAALNKNHSSSMPEKLNKAGISKYSYYQQ